MMNKENNLFKFHNNCQSIWKSFSFHLFSLTLYREYVLFERINFFDKEYK